MLKKITSRALDFIYPAACHLCESPLTHGRHLCAPCCDDLRYIEPPFCDQCGECYEGSIDSQFICPNCNQLKFSFEFALAALHSESGGRDLVHDFKYMRQIHLSDELARLMLKPLENDRFSEYLSDGLLIPVPLHWMRKRKRKFNQAEEIAKKLSHHTGVKYINALKRTRNTKTQTRFSRAKRLENLASAFSLKTHSAKLIKNKPLIIIDDVFTTGSTANECAKVLTNHGAKKVAVLTALRG